MYYYLVLSIITLAAILAIFKLKKTNENYRPFLLILIYGFIFELVGFILGKIYQNTSLSSNTYVLVAAIMWLWQFRKWNTFGRFPNISIWLAISILLVWAWNLIYVGSIFNLMIHYRVYSSFLLVILSVHQLNYLIVHYKENLFKSPLFLICTGLMVQNTLKILTECFYMINTSGAQTTFWASLILSTMLFIVAMKYLPTKKLRSSRS